MANWVKILQWKHNLGCRVTDRLIAVLDHIEAHLSSNLRLGDLARAAHLSEYHFSRVFRARFHRAPMEYVRRRRLTEAVLKLRRTPTMRVTELASCCGFESHQGFTTAFKREFHVSPNRYRQHPFQLPLQEKLTMSQKTQDTPAAPTYRDLDAFEIAGFEMEFTPDNKSGIPELWGRFAPFLGQIPGQIDYTTYGLCLPRGAGHFGYVAAVAIEPETSFETPKLPSALRESLRRHTIPAGRYAVFVHEGSTVTLARTVDYIFGTWAPNTGELKAGQPDFERYDERFDPQSATGVMEYWVPVTSSP